MSSLKFIWIIRSWCSQDTYWEHVREHKEYDIAYASPEVLLEEINRIILKEQDDWNDICEGTETKVTDRQFDIQKPTVDQIKSRSFFKFLTITSLPTATDDFMQSWYVERLKVIDTN
jgi:hypothetical protein